MTVRQAPQRRWRSYGDHPLPTGAEALGEPFSAFPSWFLRVVCDRCGDTRLVNQAHMPRSDMRLGDIIARMRHDGCGGRAGRAELQTAADGVSTREVRRIVLIG